MWDVIQNFFFIEKKLSLIIIQLLFCVPFYLYFIVNFFHALCFHPLLVFESSGKNFLVLVLCEGVLDAVFRFLSWKITMVKKPYTETAFSVTLARTMNSLYQTHLFSRPPNKFIMVKEKIEI